MMKKIISLAFIILFISNNLFAQQNEPARLALVIGVKNYTHVVPLQNTLNDARDMSTILKSKGFQVVELYDPQTKRQMQDAIVKYFNLLQNNKNSAGMVFYSGHGMQVDGSNYLIPAQANPQIKADLEDQCLNMDYVMRAIEQAGNPLNIFVLDACRNNPFRGFYRSSEQGLNMVSTPKGSYIVYATKPGSVASDGTAGNGLFTSKLLKYMNSEGLNIEQVFKRVAADVASESGDAQRPWIASDYTGDFYFTPGNAAMPQTNIPIITADVKTEPRKVNTSTGANAFGYEESPAAITIGDKQLAGKNLNVDHFANGVVIKQAKTEEEWKNATKNKMPAWCYYNNDQTKGETYGKLYNWFAVADPRKLCPAGWHVPSDEEWTQLVNVLGTNSGTQLKSADLWSQDRNGSDVYAFAGLPGADRGHNGKFGVLGETGNWWSSTEDAVFAWYYNLHFKTDAVFRGYSSKGSGFSVRCMKD